jgi:hypothetical protein
MNTFISFEDMDNKGIKRGLHGAVEMLFGKNTEFLTHWVMGISLWTIEVAGVFYDVYMQAQGFRFIID